MRGCAFNTTCGIQQPDFGRTLVDSVVWLLRVPFGNLERVMVVAGLASPSSGCAS